MREHSVQTMKKKVIIILFIIVCGLALSIYIVKINASNNEELNETTYTYEETDLMNEDTIEEDTIQYFPTEADLN